MAQIAIDVDPDALEAARVALGTGTVAETVNTALREVGGAHEDMAGRPPRSLTDAGALARWRDDGGREPEVMRTR